MDDVIRRMKQQDDMIRRLAEGPASELLRHQDTLARIDDFARGLGAEAAATAIARLSTPEFAQAMEAAERFTSEVLTRFQAPEFISAVERAAQMQHQVGEVAQRILVSYEAVAGQLDTMALHIDAVLRAMPTIDFDRIGALAAAAEAQGTLVARATETLFLRHTDLIDSLGRDPGLLGALPPPVADLPMLALFVHTLAVRSITPHEPLADEDEERADTLRLTVITETALFLEDSLPQLKPAFLAQYRGLKARATSPGPDWLDARQRLHA